MTTQTVPVRFQTSSPAQQGYDIIIGQNILAHVTDYLQPLLARPKTAIITDSHVATHQLQTLTEALADAGITFDTIRLPPGESTKSFATLEMIVGKLLEVGIERQDSVLAFGGGVVGDITGFACSMLRRGCRFVQIPTTLLAQVDSSVGGKTAINTQHGKNLAGAFYQPTAVLTDIHTLKTLPERERRAGYAEIVKYGLLGDADFFAWLEEHGSNVIALAPETTIYAIKKSCEMKARIVAEDEREQGNRAWLNLGHTFGHALEAAFGYSDTLLHGEGVSIGMALAFQYAAEQNMCSPEDSERVRQHLVQTGCLTSVHDIPTAQNISAELLMELMMQDKKVEDGKLTLILPTKIGNVSIVRNAPVQKVHQFWQNHLTS